MILFSSPLGCILKNCFRVDPMILSKDKMKRYCNDWLPNYKLDDGEWWPEYGSLQFHTTLQLMLFCH